MANSSEDAEETTTRKGLFTLNGKVFLLEAKLSKSLVEFLERK